MRKVFSPLQLAVLLGVAVILMGYELDSIWSYSVDLAHHYAVVARISEYWNLPPGNDPSLGEMNSYPRMSHTLAAVVGSFFSSALIGMQIVTLLSIIVVWSSLIFILQSLPKLVGAGAFAATAILLIFNRFFFKLELHGSEVVDNFFFAQLVAQALAVFAIAVSLYAEQLGAQRFVRYSMLLLFVFLTTGIHLLPALALLGLFVALVVTETMTSYDSRDSGPIKKGLIALLFIPVSLAGVIFHPAFEAMRKLSQNNGSLAFSHISNLKELALLAAVLAVISGAVVAKWIMLKSLNERRDFVALKYLGLYGISISGLCILQILALQLGYGSEYACKKYAFALQTTLLLQVATFPFIFISDIKSIGPADDKRRRNFHIAYDCFSAPLLLATSFFCVLPAGKAPLDTSDLVSLERQARLLRETIIPKTPNRFDYAVKTGFFPTIDYMISIAILKAPRSVNAYDVLSSKQFSDLSIIGNILTTENSKPYDIAACRRYATAGSLIILDGDCVSRSLEKYLYCEGDFDFSAKGWINPAMLHGFSSPETHGRWTDGKEASFNCKVPANNVEAPSIVRISTTGFVYRNHSQRALVSVNGSKPVEYRYEAGREMKVIELPLAHISAGEVRISFSLPDAVSPKELGMNEDTRKIAISVKSFEFE
jgi:hypothetical protein